METVEMSGYYLNWENVKRVCYVFNFVRWKL